MAYASWSVVFGEQPSASKWNILGTNDAFFNTQVGSNFGSGTTSTVWWEELGRTTLGSAGDTISVTGLASRRYLRGIVFTYSSGSIQQRITFNNDTGSNYCRTANGGGGADTTVTSTASQVLSGATSSPIFSEFYVLNIAAQEKLHHWECNERGTAGAANTPVRREGLGKWVNTTDVISRVDILNSSTGDFDTGSQLIILGRD